MNSVGVSSTCTPRPPDLACLLVQDDVGEAEDAVLLALRATQDRAHAGNELREAEWLRHVVVAKSETRDLVLGRVLRSQEDHRRSLPAVAEASGDRQPAHIGQHEVEHHKVRAEVVDRLFRGAPRRCLEGLVPLVAQRGGDGVGDRRLIVDDEDTGLATWIHRDARHRA